MELCVDSHVGPSLNREFSESIQASSQSQREFLTGKEISLDLYGCQH